MRILVLGAGGMAGHVVAQYLKERKEQVETLSRTTRSDRATHLIDVMDSAQFGAFLTERHYDVIVNCIGVLVNKAEVRKDLATYLNAYLPHFLENIYSHTETRVIHLSTDCVFSGDSPPYFEDTPHDGKLFYDRSKSLGEVANDKDLTFRMSIIGPDLNRNGLGLFNWFVQQNGQVAGYSSAIWNGITTVELARGIHAAIEQKITGVYHLVPKSSISKFELLDLIKNVFGLRQLTLVPKETPRIDKTLVNSRHDFDFSVGNYEAMVVRMREWIDAHKSEYAHYSKWVTE